MIVGLVFGSNETSITRLSGGLRTGPVYISITNARDGNRWTRKATARVKVGLLPTKVPTGEHVTAEEKLQSI